MVAFFLWASSARLADVRYREILTYTETEAPPAGEPITIATYNIGYLSGLTNNQAIAPPQSLFEQNQATAIAALTAADPDIIAFQEIDLESRRSGYVNQLAAITEALNIPFAALAINWDKHYVPFPYWPPAVQFGQILSGQALVSRYPIEANERYVLDKVASNPFYYNAFYLERVAQVSQLEIQDQKLTVINVHLEAFDSETRRRQSEFVRQLAETQAEETPVVLLGDFNSAVNREAEGSDPTIQIFLDSPVFTSALPTDGSAPTFPSDQPEYTLDYIFYTSDRLTLMDQGVIEQAAQASDHLPIQMTFRFRE